MATSCGIHIDGRHFHLVVLEGGARKHKVVAVASGELEADEDPRESLGKALKRVAKEHRVKASEVRLAVDSGLAAFRTLTLPFDDRSKIEEVIKFEVENDLPQWDIDEVVVDFLVLRSKPGVSSDLLVTAIPKERLRWQIEACEEAGLEPTEAELDATALFDAALRAGRLTEDKAQVLVYVGANSTVVAVADGGKLSSIRAIRAGARRWEPAPEPAEGEEGEAEEGSPEDLEYEAARRLRQTALRIRRELGRTLSAARTEHEIEAIYVCGHELPDLVHDEIFDTPIHPLEVLGEDAGPRRSEHTVAYGAALHALGGGALDPRLRREELRFTGRFERLELPLAVFSLFLFTLLTVQFIVTNEQIKWRDEGVLPDQPGDMQIWLMASNSYVFPDPDRPGATRLRNPPEHILKYARQAEQGLDEERTKFQEIDEIRKKLIREIDRLKKELGQVSDITLPQSALEATTLVMGTLRELTQKSKARFGIRGYRAQYQPGTGTRPDSIEVTLDMDFFADDALTATRHYNEMQSLLTKQPWCIDFGGRKTTPHDDGKGISADRITVRVDLTKVPEEGGQA